MKKYIVIISIIIVLITNTINVYAVTSVKKDDKETTFFTYNGSRTLTYNSTSEYNGGVSRITGANSGVQFEFEGTDVSIYFTTYYLSGQVRIYFDGVLDSTINCNSSSYQYNRNLYSKTGLTKTKHTVFMQNVGNTVTYSGSNYTGDFEFDYLIYTPPTDFYNLTSNYKDLMIFACLCVLIIIGLVKFMRR